MFHASRIDMDKDRNKMLTVGLWILIVLWLIATILVKLEIGILGFTL
jgi:hypothetical protein